MLSNIIKQYLINNYITANSIITISTILLHLLPLVAY